MKNTILNRSKINMLLSAIHVTNKPSQRKATVTGAYTDSKEIIQQGEDFYAKFYGAEPKLTEEAKEVVTNYILSCNDSHKNFPEFDFSSTKNIWKKTVMAYGLVSNAFSSALKEEKLKKETRRDLYELLLD